MRVKEESEAGLKLKIQKTKIMASGSITSAQIEREKVEAVIDFFFNFYFIFKLYITVLVLPNIKMNFLALQNHGR